MVAQVTLYTVTAERDSSLWMFQCVEFPGALSNGEHLDDVFDVMPEAISFVADVPEESVRIRLIADSPSAQPA